MNHDEFTLYDLKVEVIASDKPMVCSHKEGDYFLVIGDWMLSDSVIACPDPNCGARFKITRIGKRTFSHADCTVEDIYQGNED